jgi:ABC-type multidrug transport system fused ATPase/permease subunit
MYLSKIFKKSKVTIRLKAFAAIVTSLNILEPKARKKIYLVCLLQVFLGLLDLIGVAVIGLTGAVAISGIGGNPPTQSVENILKTLQLNNFDFQKQVAILAFLATFALVSRTFISVTLTRRALRFLAVQTSNIASRITDLSFSKGLGLIQRKPKAEFLFITSDSINHLIIGVLGAGVVLASDLSVLFVLSLGIFLVNPIIAIGCLIYFGLIAFFLHHNLSSKAGLIGKNAAATQVSIADETLELIDTYRENFVSNRLSNYLNSLSEKKRKLSLFNAELTFMPNIAKYTLESAVLIGALIIGAQQFLTNDAILAIANLTLFMAAGGRIVPAILRIQQNLLNVTSNSGSGAPGLAHLKYLQKLDGKNLSLPESVAEKSTSNFLPEILIQNLAFRYEGENDFELKNISFNIKQGEFFAIVGPSGSGKTTLVDLMLGALEPTSGSIVISGEKPRVCISTWPGSLSYVPQRVQIGNKSLVENIALGIDLNEINLNQVANIISMLEMTNITNNASEITELSGGQKQKIGIARAVYNESRIIIFDEATSSLDAQSEATISRVISELHQNTTIIVIAHRLSTIKNADRIAYMENGEVKAIGKFDELRKMVPNFDVQAELMGL